MQPKRILVVDDEPDVVETIEVCLALEGYEVLTAANGIDGLNLALTQRPDLVLLDVMMPGENGYRVARAIRESEETAGVVEPVPIILLTARDLSSDPEREQTFLDFSQADLMMYKPFEMDDLVARISGFLGNQEVQSASA
ncbi:MAG: PleD family two-component system response regulator [Thermoanaerobaculia bacterium]